MLAKTTRIKLFTPEAAYSYILGAITAGFMEGGSTISNTVGLSKLGESIQKAGNYAALLNGALALKVDLASKLSSGDIKPTNQNIGELFVEYVKKGGKADALAPAATGNQTNESATIREPLTVEPTQPAETASVTQTPPLQLPISNSEAERILANPEELNRLGAVITPGMTKSQQRAAVKAAVQAARAPSQSAEPAAPQTAVSTQPKPQSSNPASRQSVIKDLLKQMFVLESKGIFGTASNYNIIELGKYSVSTHKKSNGKYVSSVVDPDGRVIRAVVADDADEAMSQAAAALYKAATAPSQPVQGRFYGGGCSCPDGEQGGRIEASSAEHRAACYPR